MAQVFHKRANSVARAILLGAVLSVFAMIVVGFMWDRSSYRTGVGLEISQPVSFSHKHHAGDLGIDCRFCHLSVEDSPAAGLPATEICMKCHSQLWTNAEALAPVRQSFREGKSIPWRRVHTVPDYVFFNHSIHVKKGIGCSECHGQVDKMQLVSKVETLQMQWCLRCHRNPEQNVRPANLIFDTKIRAATYSMEQKNQLAKVYGIQKEGITDCVTCHR